MDTLLSFASTFFKLSQIESPNISVQPGKPEANCAIDILKLWDPNFFIGVSNIIIAPSPNFGFVQSDDPSVIYINADKIIAESGGLLHGKQAAIATAAVIAHEKGHVTSFDQEQGFQGGESPAIDLEENFNAWLSAEGFEKIQNLSSYNALK